MERKLLFFIIQYWTCTAVPCTSITASAVSLPLGKLSCSAHMGDLVYSPYWFTPKIIGCTDNSLSVAYVCSKKLFLVCWTVACSHGGLPCSLLLPDPFNHPWVYQWQCLLEGGTICIRRKMGIHTVVSFSYIYFLLKFPCKKRCLPDRELLRTVHVKLKLSSCKVTFLLLFITILGTAEILCLFVTYALSVHYFLRGFCTKDHDLADRDSMPSHHEGNLMMLLWGTVQWIHSMKLLENQVN